LVKEIINIHIKAPGWGLFITKKAFFYFIYLRFTPYKITNINPIKPIATEESIDMILLPPKITNGLMIPSKVPATYK